ncbi:MAG: PAS domain S-box-containing protein [Bacteroidia bacterium]|jgi:PAS domain S-box-containing protein
MKLFRHKKAVLLSVFTIIISFSITAISTLTIYNNVQKQVYERLQNIVNHEKAGIEVLINKLGVNEYDITKYLEQVRNKTNSIGENGEIILAHMVNDSIQFLISDKLSSNDLEISKSIPFATPIQKALNRENGFMKAIDANGIEVFSAFTFVEKLNCGIVAKIPTSEIKKPFVKVIIWIGISVLFFIYLYLRIANPRIDNAVIKEKKLAIANTELAFQNNEKEKRAEELAIANTELAFQNNEKEKRAEELAIANTELAFQNSEKEKRAEELVLANTELAFQNNEKEKRAEELVLANSELAFQNNEKEKRAEELAIANTELAFQNNEKDNRAEELILANKEKQKRADELVLANKEKQKRANELILANKELAYQTELDVYRSEMERVALDLTLLIDTANAPIFGIDSRGLVNEWNQTSEKITGFTKGEVLGKDLVQNYITEDYRKSVNKVLDDALLGKETANYEFPIFAKDGQRVMVLLNSSTRRDAKGKIVGVLGVGQDISEIDKLRTESESIAKELRQFIETANAPIFGIDSKGLVNEWNQTSEKITGFKKEEVLGKNLVETYITEDYRGAVKQVLDNALKGKETANYEFPLFTKDNRRVTVLLNSTTRRDADGEIVGVIGVGQDISKINAYNEELIFQNEEIEKREVELILANKELKKTNSELDRFVYSASHDLRSPLKSLLGLSNMIIDDISPENRIQLEQMVMMQSSIIKLDNFIEDILDYSRNARLEVARKAIDFKQTIDDIMKNLGHMDGADTIELKLEIDQKIEFISDRARVNMILNNIISNAIKYKDNSKKNAFIAINVDCSNDFSTISIEDNGIGIDEKNLGRIFDMFYRATNASSGSGLGLYIAKEAIEMINGTMKIESELSQGTKLSITIPNQLVILEFKS